MAHNSNTISSPVSMPDDLDYIFPGRQHSDGTYHLEDYCTDARINKFARYKPLAYPQFGPISDAQRASVAHGITIPDIITASSITSSVITDTCGNDWDYQMPTGGNNAPYRESDFVKDPNVSGGYYHDAVPPIQVNYPQNGWVYTRGSSSRNMAIYIDLDPDDSDINLQAYDFVSQGINLNQWKLIAYVDSQYFTTHFFESDDTILNDGELSGDNIQITIPGGSGSYSANVYICIYRFNNSTGRYEFMPLPRTSRYNNFPMTLYIKDDAQSSGGGIDGDPFALTSASYALNGTFRPLSDFTDGGTAKWALRSSTGNFFLRLAITNRSGSTSTIQRGHFNIALDDISAVPQYMYDENFRTISSVSIANNTTVTIYLEWDGLFTQLSGWGSSTKNYNWSFDLTRNGAYLVGSDMYAFKGADGWVARSS